MAWSAPRAWVTGELVTSAIMNQHVRDNFSFVFSPSAKITSTVTQSIGSVTWTKAVFDATTFDDAAMADLVNERLIAQTAGRHHAVANGTLGSSTSVYGAALRKNGVDFAYHYDNYSNFNLSGMIQLAVGEYVELWVYNGEAGGVALDAAASLSLTRLGG